MRTRARAGRGSGGTATDREFAVAAAVIAAGSERAAASGFPQARYLAALAPAPPSPEETVNSYPVPRVPSITTVLTGT